MVSLGQRCLREAAGGQEAHVTGLQSHRNCKPVEHPEQDVQHAKPEARVIPMVQGLAEVYIAPFRLRVINPARAPKTHESTKRNDLWHGASVTFCSSKSTPASTTTDTAAD